MPDAVVDSSVIVRWFLDEYGSASAKRVLNETIAAGDRVVVLDIAMAESANAIGKRCRRGMLSRAEAERLVDALSRLPVEVRPSGSILRLGYKIAADYDRCTMPCSSPLPSN